MKNISLGVLFLFGTFQIDAQETKTLWQKDIENSTQDFLSTMALTLDRQIILSGRHQYEIPTNFNRNRIAKQRL